MYRSDFPLLTRDPELRYLLRRDRAQARGRTHAEREFYENGSERQPPPGCVRLRRPRD